MSAASITEPVFDDFKHSPQQAKIHAMTDNAATEETTSAPASAVDPKLLDILVCPLTKARLHYDRKRQELVSEQAGLAYPIRDGIPIMLADEARTLGEDEAIPDEVKAGQTGQGPGTEEG